jgi:hypothetical protein
VTLLLTVASAATAADEARLADGRRVAGTLRLDGGRLTFAPGEGGKALPADTIETLRFAGARPLPLRVGALHRVVLRDGGRLTGQLLRLDKETLQLRTGWADRLQLPRAAVAAVTQLPGWRTLLAGPFADGLRRWEHKGNPRVADGGSVVLDRPGQELSRATPDLRAGRVGVNFRDDGAAGARWSYRLRFGGDKPLSLNVTAAGPGDAYSVEAAGLEGEVGCVKRTPGWHRLTVQFGPRSLRVLCDDAVLWYAREAGPGGPLRGVRLSCEAEAGADPAGKVTFAEFAVAAAEGERRRPPGDPAQDEVWTAAGDQWFGAVAAADALAIIAQGASGRRSLPWSEVRGLYPLRVELRPQTSDGAHVRVALRSGADPEPDVLEGVVTAIDDKQLTLRHGALGELVLPRPYLAEVRPLFFGRRLELDNGSHHLGAPGKATAGLPGKAEGLSWRKGVKLDTDPPDARLVAEVAGPVGGAGRGGARAAVVVNGRVVDYLERSAAAPRRVEVPLPRGALRAGENVVEVRLTPDPTTGRHAPCVVSGLALELPR